MKNKKREKMKILKIGDGNTKIATKEELLKWLKDKNAWRLEYYYWTSEIEITKINISKLLKSNWFYKIIIVEKNISKTLLSNWNYHIKKSWNISINPKNHLYYITRRY